ncbi:MAG: ATP-binding protein [Endomicrobia bacterium]|nr:ATP-binding protein [Endomicrobiia bacterium]
MIIREQFLFPIRPFYKVYDLVKVIIGIRRCGKSVLLSQIADELRAQGVNEKQIIFINFELYEFSHIKTAKDLTEYISSKIKNKKPYFLFFDEIQNVGSFELAVNSLRAKRNASIFITGSNSHLLSGELATHLSGRYVKFNVTPLTFKEVLALTKEKDLKKAFGGFMQWGGLPGRFVYSNESEIIKYLQDVYDSVVLRDIIQRSGLRDLSLLDNIILFLLDNSGNIFSANTISKYLKSQSRSVSAEALYNYIRYITGSLLFQKVNRYDVKGKSVFATLEKYYPADLGILQLKQASFKDTLGSRLETIVANELIARGEQIHIAKNGGYEIDFIAEKNGKRKFIQVAYHIDSDKTLQRELRAFNGIPDRKILITADNFDYSRDGVESVSIIDWLLKNQ